MPSDRVIISKFTKIKTLPNIAIHLIKLISSGNTTIRDLESVIRLDATLVIRLMRLVNSPFYALREKVDSISGAVTYIGMDGLRNLIVVEALKDIFGKDSDGDVFSRTQLWMHSAVVATSCKMISERLFQVEGENAFLSGILHDIGIVVESQVVLDLFLQTCNSCDPDARSFTKYENKIIGTNHCDVGCLLACDWRLPLEVQHGIKHHHRLATDVSPSSLTGIIQISEYLVTRLSSDYAAIPNMTVALPQSLLAHIRDNIRDYKILIRDLPEEIERARDINQFPETNEDEL